MFKRVNKTSHLNRRWVGYVAALMLSLGLGNALMADHGVTNKRVKARVELMTSQKGALSVLTDMAAGRRPLDKQQARSARKSLINNTKSIRKAFKRIEMDPHSLARPSLWTNWEDFELRASSAHKAAKNLNTRSMNNLRRSLPAMIQGCHSCHDRYKRHDKGFITH